MNTQDEENKAIANICLAHHILASDLGTLPERVKKAHAYLFACSIEGFEENFDSIECNLSNARDDDYSRVKPEELQRVVYAIEQMAYEIKRREARVCEV